MCRLEAFATYPHDGGCEGCERQVLAARRTVLRRGLAALPGTPDGAARVRHVFERRRSDVLRRLPARARGIALVFLDACARADADRRAVARLSAHDPAGRASMIRVRQTMTRRRTRGAR